MVDAARARRLEGSYGVKYTNTVLDAIARMDGVVGARACHRLGEPVA